MAQQRRLNTRSLAFNSQMLITCVFVVFGTSRPALDWISDVPKTSHTQLMVVAGAGVATLMGLGYAGIRRRTLATDAAAQPAAESRTARTRGAPPVAAESGWRTQQWLESTALVEVLSAALAPAVAAASEDSAAAAAQEYEHVLALSRDEVATRLEAAAGEVLDTVWDAMKQLRQQRGLAATTALFEKFAAFTFAFGALDDFRAGLNGRIGAPAVRVEDEMELEHTAYTYSRQRFRATNYGIVAARGANQSLERHVNDEFCRARLLRPPSARPRALPGVGGIWQAKTNVLKNTCVCVYLISVCCRHCAQETTPAQEWGFAVHALPGPAEACGKCQQPRTAKPLQHFLDYADEQWGSDVLSEPFTRGEIAAIRLYTGGHSLALVLSMCVCSTAALLTICDAARCPGRAHVPAL